jgi:hypothetical protein
MTAARREVKRQRARRFWRPAGHPQPTLPASLRVRSGHGAGEDSGFVWISSSGPNQLGAGGSQDHLLPLGFVRAQRLHPGIQKCPAGLESRRLGCLPSSHLSDARRRPTSSAAWFMPHPGVRADRASYMIIGILARLFLQIEVIADITPAWNHSCPDSHLRVCACVNSATAAVQITQSGKPAGRKCLTSAI